MSETPCVEQEFIGTFGISDSLGGYYVVVKAASVGDACREMFNVYGTRWALVYNSRDAAGVTQYGLREVPFGTPNEKESARLTEGQVRP